MKKVLRSLSSCAKAAGIKFSEQDSLDVAIIEAEQLRAELADILREERELLTEIAEIKSVLGEKAKYPATEE